MTFEPRGGRWLRVLAAVFGLLLLAAACSDNGGDDGGNGGGDGGGNGEETEEPGGGGDPSAPEQTTLEIVIAPPEFDSLVDAIWIQKLEEAGITVETVDFEFGPDTTRALASGAGAIASTSPTPLMRYIQESGGGMKIIAAALLNTDYVLLTTPDIESAADLVGKRFGISEPGDISDSTTRLLLDGHPDLDISDVEIVQIGGTSDRIAALVAGDIAGGPVHAADGLAAAEETDLVPLINYWEYIPIYAQRFIVADEEWLDENPNLAQLAVDTLIEAQREAQDDKEAFIALSHDLIPDMPDEIRDQVYEFFAEGGFFAVNGGIDAIRPTIEADLSIGNLEGEIPDESVWLDTSFVENYLEREGEV
jgi:ABC-type nitrate/sulfonate/bicarbonate transport system substrate-binding protein